MVTIPELPAATSLREIAALRGVPERTIRRDRDKARRWLPRALSSGQ